MVVRIEEVLKELKEREAIRDLERKIDAFLRNRLPRPEERVRFQLGIDVETRTIEAVIKLYHDDGGWKVIYEKGTCLEPKKELVFSYSIGEPRI